MHRMSGSGRLLPFTNATFWFGERPLLGGSRHWESGDGSKYSIRRMTATGPKADLPQSPKKKCFAQTLPTSWSLIRWSLDWAPCSCVYVVNHRWPMVCWSFDSEYLIPSPVMGEG